MSVIDAAIRAGCESVGRIGCQYPKCEPNKSFTCKPAEIARGALRAANPWEPPAEEIDAMWKAYVPEYDSQGVPFEADWKSSIIAGMSRAYRARPIFQELWRKRLDAERS